MSAERKALQFETGLVTYSLNDNCEITINPTDPNFVEKLFNTFNELDKKQEAYETEVKGAAKGEIFNIARHRDAEMRKIIDEVFEAPVCAATFGSMNVYAMADGLPVWANLIFAVMDEIDTTFAAEQKKTNPRIEKYTKKYHGK